MRIVTVVLTDSYGRELLRLVDSLQDGQLEIVLVDAATENRLTRRALEELASREDIARVEAPAGSSRAARLNVGIGATDADLVTCLDPSWNLEAGYIAAVHDAFAADPELAFVSSWWRRELPGARSEVRIPPGCDLPALLGHLGALHPATAFRRSLWQELGGFDEALPGCVADDGAEDDFWIRAARAGRRGRVLAEPFVVHRPEVTPTYRRALSRTRRVPVTTALFEKHREAFEADPEAVLVPRERELYTRIVAYREVRERRRQAVEEHTALNEEIRELTAFLEERGESRVDWGDLRRTVPISPEWGIDRGKPIDRHYIEAFLGEHAADVRGAVLEIQEDDYTRAYGGGDVERADVLDLNPTNPRATVFGDLRNVAAVPDASYDCFILTQTVHVIDDMEAVLREAWRMLRPGGVLLLTFPCLSRVCLEYGQDGDFWRLTEAGARQLVSRVFPLSVVETRVYGNVLTATAFLHGLACEELREDEFDAYDPYHPVLVGVRAVKPGERAEEVDEAGVGTAGVGAAGVGAADARASRTVSRQAPGRGLILAYHRVAEVDGDVYDLAVTPHELRAQLEHLRRYYRPVCLAEMVGEVPENAVALTFDDGYLDALDTAAPLLAEFGIPATFFLAAEGLERPMAYWWDLLARFFAEGRPEGLEKPLEIEPLEIEHGGERLSIPVSGVGERTRARQQLYDLLLRCPPAQRDSILRQLAATFGEEVAPEGRARPVTAEEARRLAAWDGVEIGAHTVHHLALSHQPFETQRREIMEAKTALERLLERPVTSFAYPYGDAPDAAVELVEAASFACAVTCEDAPVTPHSHRLRLPRATVPVGLEVGGSEGFAAWLDARFRGSDSSKH